MRPHHVLLTIPPGKTRVARGFYAGLLGMQEMEKPASMPNAGCWLRIGDFELHLAEDDPFTPAERGHPGVLVDDLDALAARLESGHIKVTWDDRFPGHRRFYVRDPFGNRLEFLSPAVAPGDVAIEPMAGQEVASWAPEAVRVYAAAFSGPPYGRGSDQVETFRDSLPLHVTRDGYHGFAARHGTSTVGFTYGYTSARNQWWHEQVRKALGTRSRRWLDDALEYVELAVDPTYRRLGIGRRLHDQLLVAQPHPRAVLSTIDEVTAGLRLYESAGWEVLVRGFRFERTATKYVIMGIELD